MNRTLLAAILLVLIAGTSTGEQAAKPVARSLELTVRILELPKKEEGKVQSKTPIFERRCTIQENEWFKSGIKGKLVDDSGSSLEWTECVAGKIKRSDPKTVSVDLLVCVSKVSQMEFSVNVDTYPVQRQVKIGEREIIMLPKAEEGGRPRLLELMVSAENR